MSSNSLPAADECLTELVHYHAALVRESALMDEECSADMAAGLQPHSASIRLLERLRRSFDIAEGQWAAPPTNQGVARRLGRFEILEELGYGSCGVVYRAHDPLLDRDVALKIPRPDTLISARRRGRFLRESRALAALRHPNLVPVFDGQELGPICYIVSELCTGPTLAQWLKDNPEHIEARLAAAVVSRLAEAAEYVHSRGILHRDIKPANILLDPTPAAISDDNELPFIPKLADFGLARLPDDSGAATAEGAILGTPKYMAPEQAAGRLELVGPATDVYALGAVLYEMLTGKPPVAGATDVEALRHAAEGRVAICRYFRRSVPVELQAICLKCLESSPSRRYSSAGQLALDLNRFLCHRPILARRAGPIARLVKWWRRAPIVVSLVAVLALSLVVGGGAAAWQRSQAERFRRDSDAQLDQTHRELLQLQEILDRGDDFDDPHFRPLRLKVAIGNLGRLREIAAQRPQDVNLRADLVECWYQVAELQYRGGQWAEAQQSYEEALPVWQELCRCQLSAADCLLRLAQTFHRLGSLAAKAHCPAKALEHFQQALSVHGAIAQRQLVDDRAKRNKSEICTEMAELQRDRSEFAHALELLASARQLLIELSSIDVESEMLRRRLSHNWHQSAVVLHRVNKPEEALACEGSAIQLMEPLLSCRAVSSEDLRSAAQMFHFRGRLLSETDQLDSASSSMRRAVALFDQLIASKPEDSSPRIARTGLVRRLAGCEAARGQKDVASQLYQDACARLEEYADRQPAREDVDKELAAIYGAYGRFCEDEANLAEARRRYKRALQLLGRYNAVGQPSSSRRGLLASLERSLRRLEANETQP